MAIRPYLTYEEYQSFGGQLDEADYNFYEFEARGLVDWYTFDRLKNEEVLPEELKECMYLLIRLIIEKHSLINPNTVVGEGGALVSPRVVSESNDGVSTTYATMATANAFLYCKNEIDNIINTCLRTAVNSLGRKLLYRGLYPGE